MRIYIYIDGFNLYYGCLRNTEFKWLDLSKLCKYLFPKDEIIKIKYFTAPIKLRHTDTDKEKTARQQIYLRALKTIPNLEVIEGFFLSHNVFMKLATGNGYIEVIKNEEKGTDVNIATHLVHDGHKNKYDGAVVISNDSDLVTPIKITTKEIGLPITIISPYSKNNLQLKSVATQVKQIRKGVLRISQFNPQIEDHTGKFYKPEKW